MDKLLRTPALFSKKEEKPKRKIAISALCQGAGASFITGQMALKYRGNANVIELGSSHFNLALGLEKRFLGKPFMSVEEILAKRVNPSSIRQFWDGINWLVKEKEDVLTASSCVNLVSLAPDGISLFDCSGQSLDTLLEVFYGVDEINIVLDPLPSKLLSCKDRLDTIKAQYPKTNIIVNKMNDGVFKGELKYYLEGSSYIEVPYYYPEDIYKAEFSCILPMFT